MYEVVKNYEQPIKFVMGFAGSGKSTELADRAKKTTLILTPTHKAKNVLEDKGLINVFTIHSALKLVPTIDENFRGQMRTRLMKIGDVNLKEIKEIFIDEFSMIPHHILDMLLTLLPEKTPVTVFGDPYQLPPINGEPIEPDFFTEDILVLNKQYRSKAPRVVEAFMRFKAYIAYEGNMDLTLTPKDGTDLTKNSNWLELFNPEEDRILAYTNARCLHLNTLVANHLDLPEEFSLGESLLANGISVMFDEEGDETIYPLCISKGSLSEDWRSKASKATEDIYKYGTDLSLYSRGTISIEDATFNIYYDNNYYENNKKLKYEVERLQALVILTHNISIDTKVAYWCSQNRDAQYVKERGRAWSAYLAHQNLVFNLVRPFATTVHKAQGSEFETVFIDQENMKKSIKAGYYGQYARLMYVALSRAVNKVILIQ